MCRTVIDPSSGSGSKLSVLATADKVSKQVDVSKNEEELKNKKAEKKARQRANKLGLKQLPAKAEDGKAEDQRGELEAASEGKLPGSSRGGTSDAAEGEHPMPVDEVQPMAVDEGEIGRAHV